MGNTEKHWKAECVLLLLTIVLLGVIEKSEEAQAWGTQVGRAPLLERYAWNVLDFAFPDEAMRQAAIDKGEYIPENALPVGIEIWRNKLFVTVPRWRDGELETKKSITIFSITHPPY